MFLFGLFPLLLQAQCISGNCRSGSGVMIYPSGARYIGAFSEGKRDGLGTCYYSDGSKYFGYWKKDLPHGEGVKTSPNGQQKSGDWRRGELRVPLAELQIQQSGRLERPKTGCLEGDCRNGQGVYVFPDGAVYTGDFRQNSRHGFGECFFPGGARYKGRWQNDQPDGNGTRVAANGDQETGIWRNGQLVAEEGRTQPARPGQIKPDPGCIEGNCQNGSGTYVFHDRTRYVGTFRNGLPNGQGVVYYPSGDRYEGRLERGNLHGRGQMISSDGRIVAGYWENGRYVQSLLADEDATPSRNRAVRIWAVVVGIASYPHMPTLFYTDDDAYRFYAFLKSPEGGAVPDNQVRLLVDEHATRSRIVDAMQDIFSKAGPNDIAILYFSGHGKPGAFLPYDNRGEFNKIYHQEITRILESSPAKVKLCIADACHSGGMFAVRGDQEALNEYYKNLAQTKPGCALILSSKSDETSLEAKQVRQGVFSHYMIRGLKGEADANDDQVVTIMEVFNFVYHKVRAYTQNRQSPIIKGQFDRDMPVSIVRN